MKVKFLRNAQINGQRVRRGEVRDLPDSTAQAYIKVGDAELHDGKAAPAAPQPFTDEDDAADAAESIDTADKPAAGKATAKKAKPAKAAKAK